MHVVSPSVCPFQLENTKSLLMPFIVMRHALKAFVFHIAYVFNYAACKQQVKHSSVSDVSWIFSKTSSSPSNDLNIWLSAILQFFMAIQTWCYHDVGCIQHSSLCFAFVSIKWHKGKLYQFYSVKAETKKKKKNLETFKIEKEWVRINEWGLKWNCFTLSDSADF